MHACTRFFALILSFNTTAAGRIITKVHQHVAFNTYKWRLPKINTFLSPRIHICRISCQDFPSPTTRRRMVVWPPNSFIELGALRVSTNRDAPSPVTSTCPSLTLFLFPLVAPTNNYFLSFRHVCWPLPEFSPVKMNFPSLVMLRSLLLYRWVLLSDCKRACRRGGRSSSLFVCISITTTWENSSEESTLHVF